MIQRLSALLICVLVCLNLLPFVPANAAEVIRVGMPAAWLPYLSPVLDQANAVEPNGTVRWQAVSDAETANAYRLTPTSGSITGSNSSTDRCTLALAIPALVVAVESPLVDLPTWAAIPPNTITSTELAAFIPTIATTQLAAQGAALASVRANPDQAALVRWQAGGTWPPGLRPVRVAGQYPQAENALTRYASLELLQIMPAALTERLCLVLTAWAAAPIQIAAVGDIMLGRSISINVEKSGDVDYPFARIAPLLADADLQIGNLECVISEQGEALFKSYTFRVGYWGIESLRRSGFDLLTMANNHALDFGAAAMLDTRDRLAAAGIATVGAGENAARARQPALITQGGVRFAFLGYVNTPTERYGFDPATARATPDRAGVAWAELDSLAADVQAAKQQADVVIVMLHSGTEWRPEPTAFQRQFARAAIDAGATAVIGAHPHIMQGMEYYGDGLIAYSLGNFVFEAYDNGQAFLRLWVAKGGIRAYAWEPYRVATNGRPIPADARATRLILQGMNELTAFVNAK